MNTPWASVALAALALLQTVASPSVSSEPPTGALAGVVLEAETGAPVPGATVHAIGMATRRLTTLRSGLNGRWSARDLPEGV